MDKNLEDVKNSLALPGGRKFVEIDKLDYRFGMGEEEQREQDLEEKKVGKEEK